MAPRSALLAHGTITASGWYDIYRGPSGWTSLVKELTLHTTAGTAGALTLWLASAGRSMALWSVGAAIPGIYVMPLEVTVPALGNLTLQVLPTITIGYTISGAYLEGVPPFDSQGPVVSAGYDPELTPLPADQS